MIRIAHERGIWLHVRPSSIRPAFFLFVPPHCLKKNATPVSMHCLRTSRTQSGFYVLTAPYAGVADPHALLDLGEAFFARLAERETKHGGDLAERAVSLETKCLERHARRQSGRQEEPDTCEV